MDKVNADSDPCTHGNCRSNDGSFAAWAIRLGRCRTATSFRTKRDNASDLLKVGQPYCFEVGDAEMFAFAGLWDRWTDPHGEEMRAARS